MKPVGIILAAGLSSRMGRDKALLRYQGQTFLDRLVSVLAPRADPLIVVLGHHAKQIAAALSPSENLRVVINADYERGMLTSLQAGLAIAPPEADGVLFTLVDHPLVQGETVDLLVDLFGTSGQKLVIPRYRDRRGHPVLVSFEIAREIMALGPDESAKDVIHRHREQTHFADVDDPGVVSDIDLPEQYEQLGGSAPDG